MRLRDSRMTDHTTMSKVSRVEVISTGARRRWTLEEKRRIVSESYGGRWEVSATARRHGLSGSQLFSWRRLARARSLGSISRSTVRPSAMPNRACRSACRPWRTRSVAAPLTPLFRRFGEDRDPGVVPMQAIGAQDMGLEACATTSRSAAPRRRRQCSITPAIGPASSPDALGQLHRNLPGRRLQRLWRVLRARALPIFDLLGPRPAPVLRHGQFGRERASQSPGQDAGGEALKMPHGMFMPPVAGSINRAPPAVRGRQGDDRPGHRSRCAP